jgi:hypothetical protein
MSVKNISGHMQMLDVSLTFEKKKAGANSPLEVFDFGPEHKCHL